ncbi:ATP-dependent helicase [Pseudaquabacterium pictum]|uniref:ATP-dependent helicase n=1 Tax=Pseudaquabacterium pictum TaxID=2315236 RepID=UPI001396BD4E|nr:ATP-dependent helicase [Rubrivivax pictus]
MADSCTTAAAPADSPPPPWLADLNPQQLAAVQQGDAPLLVLAGAGTGKTATLAARVAALVLAGVDPHRLLLLTFSRRAAQSMAQRAGRRLHQALGLRATQAPPVLPWAGTFHAIGARLLREYATQIGLPDHFSIIDRGDAQDLMALQRQALGLAAAHSRFPMAATCLAICSRTLNSQQPLAQVLADHFAWCSAWEAELKVLFRAFAAAKAAQQLLDYDDLLLAWLQVLADDGLAAHIGARFDAVLVDEYQDTNRLQAAILQRLKPDGRGLTVVGDDAQSIYRFRAAEVGNILGFAQQFGPQARTVLLERNYRSSQPILDASNAVIAQAADRHAKTLWTHRTTGPRPQLVTVADELAQARWVADAVLARREEGVVLKQQAVLFRTGSHSAALELELARRQIPFVKYGGLKFLEAAHIKDLLSLLRWGQNPRCMLAAWRAAQLVPGLGPRGARRLVDALTAADDPRAALAAFLPPPAARADWPALARLVQQLQAADSPWPAELDAVRAWYTPHLERLHGDSAALRQLDLDQLQRLAALQPSRERFLTELTLDPPEATSDEAGVPHQDEDYLILSTIHAAKGQEWDAVTVLNVIDGCMPADMATGSAAAVAEERRLLYVAMTRARHHLALMVPLRFHVTQQHRLGDRHLYGGLSRFIPPAVAAWFDRVTDGPAAPDAAPAVLPPRPTGAAPLLQLGQAWD